jgi:iron uptake system component EfeO
MNVRYTLSTIVIGSSLLIAGCGATKETAAPTSATPAPSAVTSATPAVSPAASSSGASGSSIKEATDNYRKYVIEQTDLFVKSTGEFAAAVKSGDMSKAQQLYAPSRMYYERIEPIAESFGDLDPDIDAREGDVDDKAWRGFHRIEKGLWEGKTTKGQEGYADQLISDSKLLRAKVESVEIDANVLVTGAVGLLNEVSATKVTGEEERYSHTDLYDLVANVEGSNKIFDLLKPELQKKDADLAKKIEEKFANLNKELAPFKKGDGFVLYNELTKEQTKKISQAVDALAEPLSNMGKILGA